jgi:hypothetical protein
MHWNILYILVRLDILGTFNDVASSSLISSLIDLLTLRFLLEFNEIREDDRCG